MAEAYAAIVSVHHIIEKIKQHHAPHIKSLGENPLIDALHEKVVFLENFLESCNAGQDLTISRIAEAAHAAEDVLESHIVDRIHAVKKEWTEFLWEIKSFHFKRSLEKVIQDMDLIEQEVKQIQPDDIGKIKGLQPSNTSSVFLPGSSSIPLHPGGNTRMMGFDKYLNELLNKLIGQGTERQVIPIFGMGGIGKTTLAKKVFRHSSVIQNFDLRAWVTISQQFNVRKIFSNLLYEINGVAGCQDNTESELGGRLHQELCSRRYLIIFDDMWSLEVWDWLALFLPENNNGSRIIVTTRLSTLASIFAPCGIKLKLLDDDESWKLLCKQVFGYEHNFPDDAKLQILLSTIAQKCYGLPLSLVTIGGLLAKSHKTKEYWEYVLENLNSIVSEDDEEHCLKILSLSYNELPVHLKPCFLHMGLLPEDCNIPTFKLIRQWVAEGFLKPNKDKSLEEVANDYLKDLVDRNLIIWFVDWRLTEKEERCIMHDLLRGVCFKEAQKDKFLFFVNGMTAPNLESQRRLAIKEGLMERMTNNESFVNELESASLIRSFTTNQNKITLQPTHRLLRVLDAENTCLRREVFEHVNLRYLNFTFSPGEILQLPSSMSLLWNLETLIIYPEESSDEPIIVPVEIWGMPQLRILLLYECAILPQPPSSHSNNHVNCLQEILNVINFKLTEDVLQRLPNVRELGIECNERYQEMRPHDDCCVVKNLDRLVRLESLHLLLHECPHSPANNWQQQINFPISLKVLNLGGGKFPWESMSKICLLPNLEELAVWDEAFIGKEWDAVEEQQIFSSLKLFEIGDCRLKFWNADETCFPRLQRLFLKEVEDLEEIPFDIGYIPTLILIQVKSCSHGVRNSAKIIQREQQNFGNETIQINISEDEEELDDTSKDDGNESMHEPDDELAYASMDDENASEDES